LSQKGSLSRRSQKPISYLFARSRTDHPLFSPLQKAVAQAKPLRARSLSLIRRWKTALTDCYRKIGNTRVYRLGIAPR